MHLPHRQNTGLLGACELPTTTFQNSYTQENETLQFRNGDFKVHSPYRSDYCKPYIYRITNLFKHPLRK